MRRLLKSDSACGHWQQAKSCKGSFIRDFGLQDDSLDCQWLCDNEPGVECCTSWVTQQDTWKRVNGNIVYDGKVTKFQCRGFQRNKLSTQAAGSKKFGYLVCYPVKLTTITTTTAASTKASVEGVMESATNITTTSTRFLDLGEASGTGVAQDTMYSAPAPSPIPAARESPAASPTPSLVVRGDESKEVDEETSKMDIIIIALTVFGVILVLLRISILVRRAHRYAQGTSNEDVEGNFRPGIFPSEPSVKNPENVNGRFGQTKRSNVKGKPAEETPEESSTATSTPRTRSSQPKETSSWPPYAEESYEEEGRCPDQTGEMGTASEDPTSARHNSPQSSGAQREGARRQHWEKSERGEATAQGEREPGMGPNGAAMHFRPPPRGPACTATDISNPDLENETFEKLQDRVVAEVMSLKRRFSNLDERKMEYKRLLAKWHPDKNPQHEDMAKRIFQVIIGFRRFIETS